MADGVVAGGCYQATGQMLNCETCLCSSFDRLCTHDEKEIEELRDTVKQLQSKHLKARTEIEKKEAAVLEFENKVCFLFPFNLLLFPHFYRKSFAMPRSGISSMYAATRKTI